MAFKMCNAYRASDRVSQDLIRHVIYGEREYSVDDVFLRIVLFRLFSKQSTWELLEQETGGVCRATLDVERLGDVLARRRESAPVYTAAFILATPAYGHAAKHRNHLALVDAMFKPGKLAKDLADAASLQAVFEHLLRYSGLGGFMAYQIAVDLNYSAALDFSEDSFTVAGPGALRGPRKIYSDFGDFTPSELIMRLVDRVATTAPGENRWPPAGRQRGRHWGEPMAVAGEKPMAVDSGSSRFHRPRATDEVGCGKLMPNSLL
ncbi:MAG TPA: nucleotide kinase domain-containing protein [Solirubrobacteraceae bacterium]|jgi:hypothetical protein|nr:nucleotide kinase domain-containing protein [Solirubrobacteraceae bacterium]